VDRSLQQRLREILDVNLADDELSWELLADGSWRKVENGSGVNTHRELAQLARERAKQSDVRVLA
jgi:polyphosphate kinase